MPIELRCSSNAHKVRLREDLVWKRALCPKCKTVVDPTRLRRLWLIVAAKLRKKKGSSEIPDEIRFANLRWRIDHLAAAAWSAKEETSLRIDESSLHRLSPSEIVRAYLNHIARIATGLPVPMRIPEISGSSERNVGGTFGAKDGWAVMALSDDLMHDQKAIRAVLAHEVCHYVLNCSSMNETDTELNEKLTDLCMFVFGLGDIFLNGYKSETVQGEYRKGHRLGYLTDAEYSFANRYVTRLRSTPNLQQDSMIIQLRVKIAARVGDERVIERLLENERRRTPNKSTLELYQAVYETVESGRS